MSKIPYRTYLTEEEMPRQWYNLRADMKEQPDVYLHPGTHQPITREDMLWDTRFLKQHNINAIRTSHYPNAPTGILTFRRKSRSFTRSTVLLR